MPLAAIECSPAELTAELRHLGRFYGPDRFQILALLSNSVRDVVAASRDGASTVALNDMLEHRMGALLTDDDLVAFADSLATSRANSSRVLVNRLARLGEIAPDTEQRWRALPTRLIRLDSKSTFAAVVSCESTARLQAHLCPNIRQCGLLRYLPLGSLPKDTRASSECWQSIESWLYLETTLLRQWTRETLSRVLSGARPWDQPLEQFDLLLRTKRRWLPFETIGTVPESTPILCRSLTPGSKQRKEYWIGVFRCVDGLPRLIARSNLNIDTGLRLALGQRLQAFGPKELIIEQGADVIAVKIYDKWPMPERRIFSLACRGTDNNWLFPMPIAPLVYVIAKSLGYAARQVIAKESTSD